MAMQFSKRAWLLRVGALRGYFRGKRLSQAGLVVIGAFAVIAIFGDILAPYDPNDVHRVGGSIMRSEPPSVYHPFGTTNQGRDVFSQAIVGARISFVVGLSAALVATFIGGNLGIVSGYYGGWVDDVLMRLTDIAYALPFLPFVLVLVFIFGPSLGFIILVIGLLMWRSTARVVRAEVLSQKEQPYVESARSIGASDLRVMYVHIFPNVLPLIVLYMTFGIAYSIIVEASIAFLGFGDPRQVSWGQMLFLAYETGAIRYAWWWVLPPGIAIMTLVIAIFFVGRAFEEMIDPELRGR